LIPERSLLAVQKNKRSAQQRIRFKPYPRI
jgi:hypothetical protein